MPGKPKDPESAARSYAFRLLSYRGRSRKEMLEKLRAKDFDEDVISAVMEFLHESNLINDAELASELLSYSTTGSRPLGRKGIKTLMLKRGIDKALAEEALSEHTSEMEERAAMELAEKKSRVLSNYPLKVARRRLWAMLQRRGFSAGVIRKAVEKTITN